MRPYIAFYKNKTIEIQASSSYSAQVEAARILKVSEKNRYLITVKLLDIVHSTSDL
jgi:hypothetical protein